MESQILTEIENGRYRIVDRKPNIVLAIGAIPKKNMDKICLIHDASRPAGHSLNDFATTNHFKYQSIQDATDLVTRLLLCKVDLANAYRSVRIHPGNYKATGLKWCFRIDKHYRYLVDERLSFGASRSPQVFNHLSEAVGFIMAHKGYKTIISYLDDFLLIMKTYDECI